MTAAWFGSDLLADRLARLGVRYLALNAGASIRGLHDSLVNPPGYDELVAALLRGVARVHAGEPALVEVRSSPS